MAGAFSGPMVPFYGDARDEELRKQWDEAQAYQDAHPYETMAGDVWRNLKNYGGATLEGLNAFAGLGSPVGAVGIINNGDMAMGRAVGMSRGMDPAKGALTTSEMNAIYNEQMFARKAAKRAAQARAREAMTKGKPSVPSTSEIAKQAKFAEADAEKLKSVAQGMSMPGKQGKLTADQQRDLIDAWSKAGGRMSDLKTALGPWGINPFQGAKEAARRGRSIVEAPQAAVTPKLSPKEAAWDKIFKGIGDGSISNGVDVAAMGGANKTIRAPILDKIKAANPNATNDEVLKLLKKEVSRRKRGGMAYGFGAAIGAMNAPREKK